MPRRSNLPTIGTNCLVFLDIHSAFASGRRYYCNVARPSSVPMNSDSNVLYLPFSVSLTGSESSCDYCMFSESRKSLPCPGFDDFLDWYFLLLFSCDFLVRIFDIRVGDCTGVGLVVTCLFGTTSACIAGRGLGDPDDSPRGSSFAAILTNPYIPASHCVPSVAL